MGKSEQINRTNKTSDTVNTLFGMRYSNKYFLEQVTHIDVQATATHYTKKDGNLC